MIVMLKDNSKWEVKAGAPLMFVPYLGDTKIVWTTPEGGTISQLASNILNISQW